MFLAFIAWQAVLGQADPARVESDFDLREVVPAPDADAIVVTGRRRISPRLAPLPGVDEPVLPRAALRLFGETAVSLDVEQGEVANGPSNRAMVKVRIPF